MCITVHNKKVSVFSTLILTFERLSTSKNFKMKIFLMKMFTIVLLYLYACKYDLMIISMITFTMSL